MCGQWSVWLLQGLLGVNNRPVFIRAIIDLFDQICLPIKNLRDVIIALLLERTARDTNQCNHHERLSSCEPLGSSSHGCNEHF